MGGADPEHPTARTHFRQRVARPHAALMRLTLSVAFAASLFVSGCASTGTPDGSIAVTMPRGSHASGDVGGQEAFSNAVESVEQLLASGRGAYAADPAKRSALDYCRSAEDAIERGALRSAVSEKAKALYVSQQEGDPLLSAECARSIALAYSFAGLHRRALDWADEAERYLAQAGTGVPPARAAAVKGILLKVRADAALDRNDAARARELLMRARAEAPDYYQPYVLVSLAQIDLARGNGNQADAELDAATELPGVSEDLLAIIIRSKGDAALSKRDNNAALALFSYGASLAAKSGDSYALAWAERGVARTEAARGRPDAAREGYRRAVEAAERSRATFRADELRSGTFGNLQIIFDEFVDTLASAGQWEAAFDFNERGRARSLRELSRGTGDGGQPMQVRDIVSHLPKNTALITYRVLHNQLLVWAVRSSGVRGTAVPITASTLEGQVRRFGTVASQPNSRAALQPLASQLFETLIRPANIAPGERLVIVPYGILHNLAFAALREGERWLVEDHVISERLEAGVSSDSERLSDGRQVYVFSNPDGTLPAADREAAAIAQLVPGTTVFSGAQADRRRFIATADRARVLHVAAHALFDPIDAMTSRIRFVDQSLLVQDVYGLDLHRVGLLVLSACETSLGTPSPGDEVAGFNRAFLSAGVKDLVSTNWEVNDQATALLMAVFYSKLAEAQPAADALRNAQLALLASDVTAAPAYWAPFTLTQK